MGFVSDFRIWKEQGKTTEWLLSRANVLYSRGYISEAQYNEILDIINAE